MLRRLYSKLTLVLAALLFSLGIAYALFSLYAGQLFLQEVNQRFNRDLARQLLVQQHFDQGAVLKQAAIKQIFTDYMNINPSIELYLLDTEGNILAYQAPENRIKRRRLDLAPIQRFLSGDTSYPILGDDPRNATRRKVFSAAAFPFHGPPRQYLYVVLSGENYDTVKDLLRDSYFLRVSLVAVVATVVFGLLVGLFLFHLLTRRLFHLSRLMERFRLGGFRELIPYHGTRRAELRDEIDTLGASYNAMAARIIEQMQALEEKDALRRNLVANVSHDLRTPLAALEGYLETLMVKAGSYSPAERDRYLGIAYQQSQRLTLLVAELFELSKLDAQETPPTLEPVALPELLMDLVEKFRPPAEAADVRLRVESSEGLPFVAADIAMLSRVLENLLDNAIRHTPAGGSVRLELACDGERVATRLCNSGPPIDTADLPHLFERFYQAPERRHGQGAGLGLAIVKRILELLGSGIEVESRAGQGTCFTFSLGLWVENGAEKNGLSPSAGTPS